MKQILQYSLTLFGIKAPWFSWVAAVILIIWPVYEIYKLFTLSNRLKKTCNKLVDDILEIQKRFPLKGSLGINSKAVDELRQLFLNILSTAREWNVLQSKLIYRPIPNEDDAEQVWQTESAAHIFPEDGFLGSNFNKRHFHSIPGIVTGIGLLMTFFAILVGLLDVSIVNNKVHGLESLIGGLSGKFVSSVAALFAATLFVILEKRIFHNLNGVRQSLINAIDALIPRRSESHLLDEISQNISEQTNAFRLFNSDLSRIFTNSLSQSMGPTLERMVTSIDNLNKLADSSKAELLESITKMNSLLERSEQTRQESISGQVETLLQDLQKSLSESIDRMSKEFSKSLTGTAQDQFSRVAETVGATAQVLEGMNTQFTNTQAALQELITLAQNSTENQFSNSSAIIDRMVNVFSGTLVHMEQKLLALSDTMTSAIANSTTATEGATTNVLDGVKTLNEQTAKKFIEILDKHAEQLDRIELLKQALMDAANEFGSYVTGYNTINSDLKSISKDANSAMQLLSQSTQKLKEGQDSFSRMAVVANEKIQLLADSNEEQNELWGEINSSMEQYKATFKTVENSATSILSQLSDHLLKFSDISKKHFKDIATVGNDHIDRAVGQLGTSIELLDERLEDLNEVLDKIPRK